MSIKRKELNIAKIYRFDFKKLFDKFKSDFKVMHYFISKKNNNSKQKSTCMFNGDTGAGSIRRDLIKKNLIILPDLNSDYPYIPC